MRNLKQTQKKRYGLGEFFYVLQFVSTFVSNFHFAWMCVIFSIQSHVSFSQFSQQPMNEPLSFIACSQWPINLHSLLSFKPTCLHPTPQFLSACFRDNSKYVYVFLQGKVFYIKMFNFFWKIQLQYLLDEVASEELYVFDLFSFYGGQLSSISG